MLKLCPRLGTSLKASWAFLEHHPVKIISPYCCRTIWKAPSAAEGIRNISPTWKIFMEDCLRAPKQYQWRTAVFALGMAAPPIISTVNMHFSPILAMAQASMAVSFMLYVSAKKWAFKHLSKHQFSLLRGLSGTGVQIATPIALAVSGFVLFGYPLNTLGLGAALALQAFFDATNPSYTRSYKSIRILGAFVACTSLFLMACVHQMFSDTPGVSVFSPMVEDAYLAAASAQQPSENDPSRPAPPYFTGQEETSNEVFSVFNDNEKPPQLLGPRRNVLKMVNYSSRTPLSPDEWELKWEILRENVQKEMLKAVPPPDDKRIPPPRVGPHFPPAVDPAPLDNRFGLRGD